MRQFSLAAVIVLSACSSSERPASTAAPAPSLFDQELARTARETTAALQELAEIKKTLHPPQSIDVDPNDVPAELERRIIISWEGPVIPLLNRVASEAGYTLLLRGAPNAAFPIEVFFRKRNATLNEILQDIHLQSGSRAAVEVNAQRRLIEYRYQSNG